MQAAVRPFPPGVSAVPEPIQGTAFFPGGLGLWFESPTTDHDVDFPTGGCMVVGQDFNSIAAYERARQKGSELGTSPTWQVLRRLLTRFGLQPERCFYTNAYMGLRIEGREIGRFPGYRDSEFVTRCAMFFRRQLSVARPRLILTLGMEPLRMLGSRVFGIQVPRTLTACDNIYRRVNLDHGVAVLVVLTHPSLYSANVWRRRYYHFTGEEAEAAMVQDAILASGLSLAE